MLARTPIQNCLRHHLLSCLVTCRRFAGSDSSTSNIEKTLTKFWKSVEVQQRVDSNGACNYATTLDGRAIKTPGGFDLLIPESKPTVAHLICHEWSLLTTQKIKHHALPLTAIAARAVDITYGSDSNIVREKATQQLLPYLDTDTLLTFAPYKDCAGNLRPAQERLYRPVIEEAQNFWGQKLQTLDTEMTLFGSNQSEDTKKKVVEWMNGLDPWKFTALEKATTASKSLIGGMNIINHFRTPDEVADLVNLETKLQTEQWGEVEDTHDVDHADIRRILGSCYLLSYR